MDVSFKSSLNETNIVNNNKKMKCRKGHTHSSSSSSHHCQDVQYRFGTGIHSFYCRELLRVQNKTKQNRKKKSKESVRRWERFAGGFQFNVFLIFFFLLPYNFNKLLSIVSTTHQTEVSAIIAAHSIQTAHFSISTL